MSLERVERGASHSTSGFMQLGTNRGNWPVGHCHAEDFQNLTMLLARLDHHGLWIESNGRIVSVLAKIAHCAPTASCRVTQARGLASRADHVAYVARLTATVWYLSWPEVKEKKPLQSPCMRTHLHLLRHS